LKQLSDGPLHWEIAVADCLETFESWLPLDNFDNAEWIHQQWVEMFLKTCACEIREVTKKGRRGNKRPETHLGERASKKTRSKLPELPITTSMVVICPVSNGKDIIPSPNQLHTTYSNVRYWEELIDFINHNGRPTEPYILSSKFKCTLEQAELDEEYLGLVTYPQMIMNAIYGQILYTCWLSNAFKLKLGHDTKIIVVKMMRATGKEIAEHIIIPAKVIPASHVKARCAQLLIINHRHWKVLKRVEERRERRMVGKRMILVLM